MIRKVSVIIFIFLWNINNALSEEYTILDLGTLGGDHISYCKWNPDTPYRGRLEIAPFLIEADSIVKNNLFFRLRVMGVLSTFLFQDFLPMANKVSY
jgi:hypothetical protein